MYFKTSLRAILPLLIVIALLPQKSTAQINSNGCTITGFGINSNIYTNTTFTTGNPRPPADEYKSSFVRHFSNKSLLNSLQIIQLS